MAHVPLTERQKHLLPVLSFAIPLLLWCAVSYLPFIWHPQVQVSQPGGISYFEKGMTIDRQTFMKEVSRARASHMEVPQGIPVNPVYFPAPHQVARAFYTAFTTPPQQAGDPWLHQSLWHSIRLVFIAFFLSSLIGVPLGIASGVSPVAARLVEPFVEFFRYLPAPAFGTLAVAILGIMDAPKIAIIVIGTLFQQILIVGNTIRQVDSSLIDAGATLGARGLKNVWHVAIPSALPGLYQDQRILLGWAWTYLIVAELVGTSSGITWFITQQARYQHFDNVFAAIIMIGIIGLSTDWLLARGGRKLFPWQPQAGVQHV